MGHGKWNPAQADPRGGYAALKGWRPRREEVGKAYRNLPTLLSEIRLNIFQGHDSTLSAMRAEEISKRGAAKPSSGVARDMSSSVAIQVMFLPARFSHCSKISLTRPYKFPTEIFTSSFIFPFPLPHVYILSLRRPNLRALSPVLLPTQAQSSPVQKITST